MYFTCLALISLNFTYIKLCTSLIANSCELQLILARVTNLTLVANHFLLPRCEIYALLVPIHSAFMRVGKGKRRICIRYLVPTYVRT